MNKCAIYITIVLLIWVITVGCSDDNVDNTSDASLDSGGAYADAGNKSSRDGSTRYPTGDPCSGYPGIDEYIGGINGYIYHRANSPPNTGSTVSQLYMYCFTKGTDCSQYKANIKLYIEADNLPSSITAGELISLLACSKSGTECGWRLTFYVENGTLDKGIITVGTKIEVNNVSVYSNNVGTNNTQRFSCVYPPYVRLSGSLENARLIDALPMNIKDGEKSIKDDEDSGVLTADAATEKDAATESATYITLIDSDGNVVADFR
jgi:hypothetical protein